MSRFLLRAFQLKKNGLSDNLLLLNSFKISSNFEFKIAKAIKSISSTCMIHYSLGGVNTTVNKTIQSPDLDGQLKVYSSKIQQLVEQITQLNLVEVSDLNELLRKKLNIKDISLGYTNSLASSAGVLATSTTNLKSEEPTEQEITSPKAVKSSFKLKLVKFDEAKKVALIKEIKALGENMNLVQAKKFIESLPQTFKDNIQKDDAEKLKLQLEKVGATCEIE
jgi:large subunit ribosomal protein L7/L12